MVISKPRILSFLFYIGLKFPSVSFWNTQISVCSTCITLEWMLMMFTIEFKWKKQAMSNLVFCLIIHPETKNYEKGAEYTV